MNSPTTDEPTKDEPNWDDAFNEAGAAAAPTGAAPAAAEPSWDAALREQTESQRPQFLAPEREAATSMAPATPAGAAAFPPLSAAVRAAAASIDIDRVMNIPVVLTAELGHTRLPIKNLLQLSQGSVVELEELAGQPLDVKVNGYLVAHGEVVVTNERYGIRLTDIVAPSERIEKLGRQ